MTERTTLEDIRKKLYGLGYPNENVREEYTLGENTRADLVVLDDAGSPLLIAEAKSPSHLHIALARSQLETYIRKTNSRYGVLSDGIETHYYVRIDSGEIIEVPTIPRWREQFTSHDWETSKLKTLTSPVSTFWKVNDILRTSSVASGDRLRELQKILLCKFIDETQRENLSKFSVIDTLSDTSQPIRSTKAKIDQLFEHVKSRYPDIFPTDERIHLDEQTIAKIVGILQSYSITQNPSAFSKAFERIIEESFVLSRGFLGTYYTPRPIAEFLIDLLGPRPSDKLIDLACGTGQILLENLEYLARRFPAASLNDFTSNIFGIDKSAEMVSIAKTNMVLHGDGRSSIFLSDTLSTVLPPQVEEVIQAGGFDLVVVDPPLGMIIDTQRYPQSVLGTRQRIDSAVLFLETAVKLSKVGGRIAIVLPEKFLFSEEFRTVRDFMKKNTFVRAIVRMPTGVLRPFTGISVNVVVFEKRVLTATYEDYPVLMADAQREEVLRDIAEASRIPQHITAHGTFLIQASELGSDWSVRYHSSPRVTYGRPLGDHTTVLRGASIRSQEYLEDKTQGIPLIRISDISNLDIQTEHLRTIDESTSSLHLRSKANANDVVLSISGTIGKVGMIPSNLDGSVVHSNLVIVRPDQKFLRPEFLAWFLSSKYVKDQLARLITGSIIQHISINAIKELRIPVPSLEEQDRILTVSKNRVEQLRRVRLNSFENEIAKLLEVS